MRALTIVVFLAGCLAVEAASPERKVEVNVVTSKRDPKVRIELPRSVQYVGADRWALYGIADCELHAFVEADSERKVERLYWVQFEGYPPTKPGLHYRYDSPRHITIGGLDFCVDTWVAAKNEKTTPGSDLEHIQSLIRSQGYTFSAGMMVVRLVHLLDEQKRKELMIIYAEDLVPSGLTAAELKKDGKTCEQWPKVENGAVDRATSTIKIEQL
jgi:hypothetical protein